MFADSELSDRYSVRVANPQCGLQLKCFAWKLYCNTVLPCTVTSYGDDSTKPQQRLTVCTQTPGQHCLNAGPVSPTLAQH